MPGTPTVLHAGISGLPLSGSDYNDNLYLIENSFLDTGPAIISGLTLSIGLGLAVDVAAGVAVVGSELTVGAFSIGALMPATTNHVYLLRTGIATSNDTGIAPAGSVKLGTATTDGIGVTSVAMGRTSGRQQFRQPQDLIPGGPAAGVTSAGHPNSVNLGNWAAAAGEGVAVYGMLPNGAQSHTDAAYTAPPLAATWTPINLTTATLVDSASGGLFLHAPNIAVSHLEGFVKTLAAGAYTLIVRLDLVLLSTTFTAGGLMLRDSVGGKILTVEQSIFGSGPFLEVEQWSDANTRFGTSYGGGTLGQLFPWFKIVDDNVNRHYFASKNGNDWCEFAQEVRTNYLGVAPDQIGFFATANGNEVGVNLYSWAGA